MSLSESFDGPYQFPDRNDVWVYEFCDHIYRILTKIKQFRGSDTSTGNDVLPQHVLKSPFVRFFLSHLSALPKSLKRRVFAKIPTELFRYFPELEISDGFQFDESSLLPHVSLARKQIMKTIGFDVQYGNASPGDYLDHAEHKGGYYTIADNLLFVYVMMLRERPDVHKPFLHALESGLDADDPFRYLLWIHCMPDAEFDVDSYPFFRQHHRLSPTRLSHSDALYSLSELMVLYHFILEQFHDSSQGEVIDFWDVVCEEQPLFDHFIRSLDPSTFVDSTESFSEFMSLFLFEVETDDATAQVELRHELLSDCNAHLMRNGFFLDSSCEDDET